MIRQIYTWEIQRLEDFARAFHAEANIGGEFSPENWRNGIGNLFLSNSLGAFGVFKEGELVGVLVGQVSSNLFANVLTANELMWYILPDCRGSIEAVKLVKVFEDWAASKGASAVIMAHLKHSPEGIAAFYQKRGYAELETHYLKWQSQPH